LLLLNGQKHKKLYTKSQCILIDPNGYILKTGRFGGIPVGKDVLEVEMPNDHIIKFDISVDETKLQVVARSYWNVVIKETQKIQKKLIVYSFLYWAIPSLFVLLFGHSIAWVIRGFKKPNKANAADAKSRAAD